MDCQTAIEYINLHVDNMLGDADIERLFEHIRSCEHCKKELDNTLMLKNALSNLDELEPPAGLALGAIKKARKRKIPVFAYASAVLAVAIALFAVFSSALFPNDYGDATGSVAFEKSIAQDVEAPEAAPASEAPQMAAMPAATAPGDEGTSMLGMTPAEGGIVRTEAANGVAVSVTVPSSSSKDFRESLNSYMDKYGVTPGKPDENIVSFSVPTGGADELKALIAAAGVSYEGELSEGSGVEFTFE